MARSRQYPSVFLLLFLLVVHYEFAAASDEGSLTVQVTGMLTQSNETMDVEKATVRVHSADFGREHSTNKKGESKFKLPMGLTDVIITGEDTQRHWATASCSINVTGDLVISVVLDLEEPTSCVINDIIINIGADDGGNPRNGDDAPDRDADEVLPEVESNDGQEIQEDDSGADKTLKSMRLTLSP